MRRLAILASAIVAVFALPALASATIAFNKYTKAGGNPAIYVANDDGTGVRAVGVQGIEPAISPNGQWIAYTYITNIDKWTRELRMVNVATGAVVDANQYCGGPIWAPDSSKILCSTTAQKASGDVTGIGLASVTTAGVATTVVKADGNNVGGYAWSPSGTQIAYAWQRFPGTLTGAQLRIANPDGSGAVRVGLGSMPIWGAKGIAYVRTSIGHGGGQHYLRSQIWTMNPADPASAKQLTNYTGKGLIEGPTPIAWSPDGSTIVANVTGEDYMQPAYIRVADGKVRPFGPANALVAAISADGTQGLVNANILGGGKEVAYASPLAKMASSLILKNASSLSATANWQP